jgi:RND family efflux transporter MFP subunit
MNDADDKEFLKKELDRAYLQMAEITSRLLAVNEAGESFADSHDQETLATTLLEISGRAVFANMGVVFQAQGEGEFAILASMGIEDEDLEEIERNMADIAICNLVQNEEKSFSVEEAREHESFREWSTEYHADQPEESIEPSFRVYLPLSIEETVLGVLALGPRQGEAAYGEEERLFLEHIAGQGALALDRAVLFAQNEDRLQDLDALLKISRELTSTLDLDRVLLTAVNTTAAIVERERAVLALLDSGKLVIRAVSDFPHVDSGTAERLGLARLLAWLGLRQPDLLNVNATRVQNNPEMEGQEILQEYLQGEMRSLLAIRLKDDQGTVGYLLLESFDENAFAREADRDALTVLAGQLAVSIRNAELYKQLPMVSALGGLAARRQRWKRMTPGQRRRVFILGAVALVIVALIPWPRSVAGDARVLPSVEVPVRAAVEGILDQVLVQSGDRVRSGQLLARLDATPAGARMAELRAEASLARSRSAQAEDVRDPVERRLSELRRQQALARLAAARREEGQTELLAPVNGYVLTPLLEEREGALLEAGDMLCQVSPLDTMNVDVAISETDIQGIKPGQRLRIKVLGFPDRQYEGEVTGISWQGEESRPGRGASFVVRGWVANPGPELRSGMTGRARVDVAPATLLWRWTRGLIRSVRLGLWV